MNDKFKNVKSDIKRDQKRELAISNNEEIENVKRQIEQVQGTISDVLNQASGPRSSDDLALNIAIRNLAESDNENIMNKVDALIKDGLRLRNISCEKAVRKTARGDNRNGVIIATCESADDKKEIMRNKSKLKERRQYEAVYIEHDRTLSESNQISNLRKLVTAVGGDRLRVQGSRVVFAQHADEEMNHRDNYHRHRGTDTRDRESESDRGHFQSRRRRYSGHNRDNEEYRYERRDRNTSNRNYGRSNRGYDGEQSRSRYSRR